MSSFLIATRNPGKTREFQQILGPDFEIHDLTAHPEIPETTETGITFRENAILKAEAVSRIYDDLVLADDSGLEVDCLGGAPGVFSARYAGAKATAQENIQKLLRTIGKLKISDNPRKARFRCLLALALHDKVLRTFEGVVDGKIIDSPRGSGGFGYDPVFVPDGFDETLAELPAETKNRISHRSKAVRQLEEFLKAGHRLG